MSQPAAIQPANARISTLRDLLERARPKLAEVTPKHLTAERLTRIALACCGRTVKLLQCDPKTVLNSVMQAAQLGLEPGGALGEAYLVPYKTTCQLIVGYRGFIKLARQSGEISTIEAQVVRQQDKFHCRFGTSPLLEHEPSMVADRGGMLAVYAIARLKDGTTQVEVMTKNDVEAIRSRSHASDGGPWVTDFDEMARKSVVRRLCKYLPLSPELATAIELENRAESGEDTIDLVDLPQISEAKPATKTESLKERLKAEAPEDAEGEGESEDDNFSISGEELKRRARENGAEIDP